MVAVNDERVFRDCLRVSPVIDERCQVVVKRGYENAGKAYNSGLAEADHEIVVFAHQDVFLPATWLANLSRVLAQLEAVDSNWGVLGPFGVARAGGFRGHCYSTGLRRILGSSFDKPIPAQSLDEFVLIVRRSSGLKFDENLPGFHLYGADICLEAAIRGIASYIIPAFCIHNANGVVRIPAAFWRGWFYLRRKWMQKLPVSTCCTTITKWCTPVVHRLALEAKWTLFPREVGSRCENIRDLYAQLATGDSRIRVSDASSSEMEVAQIQC